MLLYIKKKLLNVQKSQVGSYHNFVILLVFIGIYNKDIHDSNLPSPNYLLKIKKSKKEKIKRNSITTHLLLIINQYNWVCRLCTHFDHFVRNIETVLNGNSLLFETLKPFSSYFRIGFRRLQAQPTFSTPIEPQSKIISSTSLSLWV